jgi:hypothetical protein
MPCRRGSGLAQPSRGSAPSEARPDRALLTKPRRSTPLRRSGTPERRSPNSLRLTCSLGLPGGSWRRSDPSRRSRPERRSRVSRRIAATSTRGRESRSSTDWSPTATLMPNITAKGSKLLRLRVWKQAPRVDQAASRTAASSASATDISSSSNRCESTCGTMLRTSSYVTESRPARRAAALDAAKR